MDFVFAIIDDLINAATRQLNYSCCYKTHLQDFVNEKMILDARRESVLRAVEKAHRNGNQVLAEVQLWLERTKYISREDVKTTKKCFFGWCPDCIWRYRQGRMLRRRMRHISELMAKSNTWDVVHLPERSGITCYFSENFIDFESRKSEFEKLVKALEDENCSMIGLYGMGGTGKTTLAEQVGIQVEKSRLFGRVIFVDVSSPPVMKRIQFKIASELSLELGEGKDLEVYSKILQGRIAKNHERLLIILDGVWEELNLKDIGIPSGRKCCVLITTRDSRVCKAMRCQQTIRLLKLTDRDALNLFTKHVGTRSDGSFNELIGHAQQIVHECEGLPIAVVAIANTLKNWPLRDWKIASETLQHSEALHNVVEDMTKVYESLRPSYDRLEENAKYVFLLCSLFPESYEIPIDLLCKLSIGLGLYEEVPNYLGARMKAIRVKDILVSSSLLLEAKEAYVKMHSIVREMALWVSNKDLQVIMDSSKTVKSDIRFLFWSRDDISNQFDGTRVEILVHWIKGKVKVEDSCTILRGMPRLRVLFLHCDIDHKYDTLSLILLLHLRKIRTIILDGLNLDNMSVLEGLHDLEILELTDCLITELPNEIRELKNLRSLGLRKCKIERNNPFKVIERCIQLEVLDFVLNSNIEGWKEEGERKNMDKVAQDVSPPPLKRYSIACPHLKYFDHDENGMLNCFNTENVKSLISNAMFKNIVRRAEVLELGEIGAGWKSLVPDIIPMEDGGMNDLIKLYLYSLVAVECLVDSRNHADSQVEAFSNLVELYLDGVDVKELYRGRMISGFLCRLQDLKLRNCKKLCNIFDGNLKLPHLKVLHLINCPMFQSSIFQSSVAQSLEQLQELIISDFEELNRVITYESMVDVDNKNGYSTLFPNLKTLEIKECGKLELISPLLYADDLPLLEAIIIRKCEKLKCIFGEYRGRDGRVSHQEIVLPSLAKMVLDDVPNFITMFQECNIDMKGDTEEKDNLITARRAAFSWAHGDNEISSASLQDHTISPELPVSMKATQTFHTAQCLLRQPLNLQNIRQMRIVQCSNLMSLFTLSIAEAVLLEKLTIQWCDKLKHVMTNVEEDHEHMDCISIFPELEELLIVDCKDMEFIFPSTSSVRLKKLKSVIIGAAPKLKHVFGRFSREEYLSNEIETEELYIDLPALETLSLTDVPNMISICSSNGRQLNLETEKESPASRKEILTFHTVKCLLRRPLNLQNIRQMTIGQCSNLMSLFTVSIAKTVKLEKLTIQRCDKLKHVMTNEEDHDHIDYISIFPELEELLIVDCRNIESIFPSTSSVRLQKLKFVIIRAAPELKYVFGRFGRQELSIDVPVLETVSLTNVPNVIAICTNGRRLSLETAKNLTSQGAVKSEIEEIIDVGRPISSSVSTEVLNFHNLREIKVTQCRKIKAMFPASTWKSLSQLSKLCILNCGELAHLVDEDSKDFNRFSGNYILPKLEYLQIQNCNKLGFIFPSSFLRGLQKLKSMIIEKAVDLKYIFEDNLSNENESVRFKIDLPALETLSLRDVPNIINICAKRNFVMFPSLQKIALDNCQELIRNSQNLTVYWKPAKDLMKICMHEQKLTNLEVGNSTINEVFNLEGVNIGGLVRLSLQAMVLENLSELKQICKGPNKSILSFYHLRSLEVKGCKSLRTIFSISIMKSLPNLFHLEIRDCEELVHIIEEDPKESAGDDWLELNFPKLEKIHIKSCNSLKFLFSISTPNMFPKLERLEVEEASELEQIFTCEQEAAQKMVVKDEFPNLSYLRLTKLPKLVTIAWGIGFQTLTDHQVVDCPKYQEINSGQVQQEPEILDSDNQAATEEPLSPHFNNIQAASYMGETSSLADSAGSTEKTLKEIVAKERTPALEKQEFETSTAKPLPRRASLRAMEESIGQLQHQELGEKKKSIGVPEKTNIPLNDDSTDAISKERVQQVHISEDEEDLKKAKPRSEPILTHQQEQGEISASVIENIPRDMAMVEPKLHASTIDSEPVVDGLKEIAELGFQEHDKSKEDKISIQQKGFGLTTQSGQSSNISLAKELSQNIETGKQVVGITIASEASETKSSSNSKIDKETGQEIDKSLLASKLRTAKTSQDSEVDGLKETAEQGFQEHAKSKENITSIQIPLAKELSQNSETGKQVEGTSIASEASVSSSSSNSKVDSVKETMGQSFQEYGASPEATILAAQSADLEPRKQSKISSSSKTGREAGGILVALQSPMSTTSTNSESTKEAARESADTSSMGAVPFDLTVEQTGHASVEEEQQLDSASKLNLPNVIPSLNHQSSQIGTGSPSPASEILEIFDLAELKDGEAALLARALKQYPQLVLPREQRTQRRIAFSYRVLVDILVMLANKTLCTITTSEKSTLDDNLCEATSLGFNKGWVDSVRAKVFDIDMSDVLSAQEKIRAMEAELQTYDMMLKQVQKEKQEAARQVEIAQSWFDAIDSKLSSLLKDRNTLKANMTKLKNIISAQDTPFGI